MQKAFENELEIIGSDILEIEVKNPVEFVMEVFGYDDSNNENSKGQIRRLGTMLLKNIL